MSHERIITRLNNKSALLQRPDIAASYTAPGESTVKLLDDAADALTQSEAVVATLRQALTQLVENWAAKADDECLERGPSWVGAESALRLCAEELTEALAAVPAPAAPPVPSTVVHVVVGEPMRCGYCGEKATEFYSFNSDVQPDICPECYALAASAAPAAPQEPR